jgi:hypothetical protein
MQATLRRERILSMFILMRRRVAYPVFILWLWSAAGPAKAQDAATLIQHIDAVVEARDETVEAFTDVEHYSVYRGKDQTHPVAEMTVKDTYSKGAGKTYTILSQSGSAFIFRIGLKPLLENEQVINQPGNVQQSWFNSANYEMKPGNLSRLDGRNCFIVAVTARRRAPNTIYGNIWIDAQDYSLAQIEGIASKSPSPFAGTTHLMRQYTQIDGFSMATRARAESDSLLFGHTVVTIDYSDYHLQLVPHR